MGTTYRKRWTHEEGVRDMTGHMTEAADMGLLTIDEVAEQTGYSPNTLKDMLSRPPRVKPDDPKRPLSRPYAKIGGAPYYSPEQVRQSKEIRESNPTWHERGQVDWTARLPLIDPEDRNQHWTMHELSRRIRINGLTMSPQTLRRWAEFRADFPRPVGLIAPREDGFVATVPLTLYPIAQAVPFLRAVEAEYMERREAMEVDYPVRANGRWSG